MKNWCSYLIEEVELSRLVCEGVVHMHCYQTNNVHGGAAPAQ